MKKILYKLFGTYYSVAAIGYRQFTTYCYSILHPYHYDASRYANTVLLLLVTDFLKITIRQ